MWFFNRFFFVGMLAGAMLAVGAPLLVFGVIGVVAQSSGKPPTVVGLQPLAFPEEEAPALSWELRDMTGRRLDVADLGETVLFVNNWATWCGPCLIEMPAIDALAERLADEDVAFVIVSDESLAKVRRFVEARGWGLPFYVAKERPPMFQTRGIPSTFILDEHRRVVYSHVGSAAWDDGSAAGFVDRLIGTVGGEE